MAYNLQSLITILKQILNPEQKNWILDHNQPQLQSLLQKATSLHNILDKYPFPKIESTMQIQIREAAHKAEDIIESHWVDEMLSIPEEGVNHTFITPDLQQVMRQLDSITEQVVKLVEVEGKKTPSGSYSSIPPCGASLSSIVVGVDEDLMQLKDRLAGTANKLEIVPILGMGGIGKTTIARKLYKDQLIVYRFRSLAWATVSQDYDMKAILTSLLRGVIRKEEFDDEHSEKDSDELKDVLYQSLYGRRYMIVLDDIWNVKFWDEIRVYFPDNNNGSRIVMTTRESAVAKHADSLSMQHWVQLLSKSDSWNLLRQIVFGEAEEDCPHELQGIGERIASDCGGLPLAINVIGGVLSKVERSIDVWESIGRT